jgi:anhydro-N-acetylmuramic acid kinase
MATAVDLILDPAICCWTPGANSILADAYDDDGNWGASGAVDNALLSKLKAHPFLAQTTPRSTGREEFNLPWLKQQLQHFHLSPEDIQATLTAFTAQTLADCINNLDTPIDEVFVCGGGAFNGQLMAQLQSCLHNSELQSTAQLGLEPRLGRSLRLCLAG